MAAETSGIKSVGKALQYLQKKHGDNIAFMADDESFSVEIASYKSSSYSLNDVLGIGGIPAGRLTQFAGIESSGKTMLSLDFIKHVQQQDPANFAVFIDAEFTFSKKWAAQQGVDLDRLIVIRESSGIEIWKTLVGDPTKKDQPGLLKLAEDDPNYKGLKLVVLDSIATIVPPADENYHAGKESMATLARFLGASLKRLTPYLSRSGVAMIAINQIRMNPGVMWGDPTDSPGGKALKHACSVMVNFAKINTADTIIKNDDGEQIGHRIRARIGKNKVAEAYKVCEFDIEYTKGIVNTDKEVVDLAIKYGAIEQKGPMYYINNESFKGRALLYEYIKKHNAVGGLLEKIEQLKVGFEEKPLAKQSVKELLSTATLLEIEIPKADQNNAKAIRAHIESLSANTV